MAVGTAGKDGGLKGLTEGSTPNGPFDGSYHPLRLFPHGNRGRCKKLSLVSRLYCDSIVSWLPRGWFDLVIKDLSPTFAFEGPLRNCQDDVDPEPQKLYVLSFILLKLLGTATNIYLQKRII